MSNLRISELDFDQIKLNLKNFLKAQTEFTDYDFEGSALSSLVDLLAYNTHYNAYLANMNINEMFLDSAVKKSSAVSLAKHLNYTPLSVRSASASLSVTVNNPTGLPRKLTIERYTPFNTTINGKTFTFVTNETYSAERIGTLYTFSDITVFEGTPSIFSYPVSDNTPNFKYTIPNANVDTSTLYVSVQNSTTDTTSYVYTQTTDITGLDGTSKIYYLEQNTQGKYQIYFGDGVLGKQLSIGNNINIRYLISSGTEANLSNLSTQSFAASGSIGGGTVNVTVNSNSTGGGNAESIDSIKFNAPKFNAAKNRAVTASDYETLILSNYAGAEAVSVWGGEDNEPPHYGRVMISLKPYEGYTISTAAKDYIKQNILNNKQVAAITPLFVDPSYLFLNLTAKVVYNPNLTNLSSDEISTVVTNAVNTYFTTELQKYNKNYNNSKLIKSILNSNTAITSVILTLGIQKRIVPLLNTTNVYISETSLKFRNPIKPGSISSTYFYIVDKSTQVLVKIVDLPNDTPPNSNGYGTLRLVLAKTGTSIKTNIGTVNYSTGVIDITGIIPTSLPSNVSDIRITAGIQESFYNVEVLRNEILLLDDTTLNAVGGLLPGFTISTVAAI